MFEKKKEFGKIKKLIPRAHIEPCKNMFKSINYCKKEDTRIDGPIEFGVPPEKGKD